VQAAVVKRASTSKSRYGNMKSPKEKTGHPGEVARGRCYLFSRNEVQEEGGNVRRPAGRFLESRTATVARACLTSTHSPPVLL
jgi:hypothetical protein